MLTLILISGLSMGLRLWSIWRASEFKDFIQINKSDEFIEVNVGPPYNKQLFKIPNFEVVQLQTSLDSGFTSNLLLSKNLVNLRELMLTVQYLIMDSIR